VLAHRGLNCIQVLDAEAVESVELAGEAAHPIGESVREARVAEAAVST
jgi:hypothetical protein